MSLCEYTQRVHSYHDGELRAEGRRELAEHLRQCPACARELERLRSLSGLFAEAVLSPMPVDLPGRLHGSLRSVRERVIVRMAEVLMAAAAAVLVICSALLWQASAAGESDREPVSAWERAAAGLEEEEPLDIGAEVLVAQWIVEDLSLENAHE